jgi:superfamily II DNA or RNA helicase
LLGDIFASYKKVDKSIKKLSSLHWNKPFVDIKEKWNKNNIALIIDESHELKSTKAVRTKALLAHKDYFNYRYLLSATPAINKFEDWWTGMFILDKGVIQFSENAFKIYIANDIGDNYSIFNIRTYNKRHINDVKSKLQMHVLKRLKKDLPEVKTKQIIKPIYLRMTQKQYELYRSFIHNEVVRLKEEFDTITARLIFQKYPYLVQIIDNPMLLVDKVENDEVNNKLRKWKFEEDARLVYLKSTLEDYIDNLNEKVIIFDNHPVTLSKLADMFSKYNPLVLHGQLKDDAKERQRKIDLFNDKKSLNKLFLISTQIGGAGLNLHYACRRIIFYTLPNDATLTRQAQDRIYRVTSEHDSIVEMLIFDHSIDLIRYNRNISRIELNDNFLNKPLSDDEINRLFLGAFLTNK